MAIKRRPLLQFAAGLCIPGLNACSLGGQGCLLSGFQSASANGSRQFGIAALKLGYDSVELDFSLLVPQRVHQVIARPVLAGQSPQACFIARRPGTEIYLVDLTTGLLLNTLSLPGDRHCYGHACFSQDGRYLFVPQNHLSDVAASIAVFEVEADARQFTQVAEIPLPVIGPHQIEMLSDDKTLVLAVGGILTHPDSGRKKLNLDSMQSELLYLDSTSSKVLARLRPDNPRQSIRHMAVSQDDRVVVGVQYQGRAEEIVPLAYSHRLWQQGDSSLQALQANQQEWAKHKQYIGSVCMDQQGHYCYLSSPKGGVLSCWQIASGELQSIYSLRDGCGLAFNSKGQGFIASNGLGQLINLGNSSDSEPKPLGYLKDKIWDNHMLYIEA